MFPTQSAQPQQDVPLDDFFRDYHGRRMSSVSSTYPLPVDDDEVKRSELHHRMMQFVFSGKNYVGPVKEALQFGQKRRILDLGTGSGQWAIDMADEFPRAEVIGIDIAPIQPKYVPPNCTFETCDLDDAFLPYPSASFDLIHARSVHLGVRNYPRLAQEIGRLLRPGGLVLLVEPDLEPIIIQDNDIRLSQANAVQAQTATDSHSNLTTGGSDSNSPCNSRPTIFASPAPLSASRWQQSPLTSTNASTPPAPSSRPSSATANSAPRSYLTTNRQLNSILNPLSQTPVPYTPGRSLGRHQQNPHHPSSMSPSSSSVGGGIFPMGGNQGVMSTGAHAYPGSSASQGNPGPRTPPSTAALSLPLIGSPHSITGKSVSPTRRSTSSPADHRRCSRHASETPKMHNWARLWSTFRACLEATSGSKRSRTGNGRPDSSSASGGIDTTVPRRLTSILAATELFENIIIRQANVPVGFWPRDPHLLTVGQLQWMDYELLLPAMRPFFLSRMASNYPQAPKTADEVDTLIRDAQHDLYYPSTPLFARIHIVYASKRLDVDMEQ